MQQNIVLLYKIYATFIQLVLQFVSDTKINIIKNNSKLYVTHVICQTYFAYMFHCYNLVHV